MMEGAVQAAREMQLVAAEYGLRMRIGIHCDDARWYALEHGFSFEGTGPALDKSKRLESGAGDGETAMSVEALEVRGTHEGFGDWVLIEDKHGFEHQAAFDQTREEGISATQTLVASTEALLDDDREHGGHGGH